MAELNSNVVQPRSPTVTDEPNRGLRHSRLEDVQAMVVGTLIVALAVTLFKDAGLLSGGTVGIAFLIHYLGVWSFGAAYFVVNLPFYWLAWRQLGPSFTMRTFIAVSLVSVMSDLLPRYVVVTAINPWLAAVLGGALMGNGFLVLFRHRASLGGVGVLALWAQKTRGWRAGHVQMLFDAAIVAAALLVAPPLRVLMSITAIVVLNLVIATNHRPGRYMA